MIYEEDGNKYAIIDESECIIPFKVNDNQHRYTYLKQTNNDYIYVDPVKNIDITYEENYDHMKDEYVRGIQRFRVHVRVINIDGTISNKRFLSDYFVQASGIIFLSYDLVELSYIDENTLKISIEFPTYKWDNRYVIYKLTCHKNVSS